MQVSPTAIPGLLLLQAKAKPDNRGTFCELWTAAALAAAGVPASFAQLNYSRSRRGALRGLHYQAAPHGQAKLITVMTGRIYDVAVDLRRSSPTFG